MEHSSLEALAEERYLLLARITDLKQRRDTTPSWRTTLISCLDELIAARSADLRRLNTRIQLVQRSLEKPQNFGKGSPQIKIKSSLSTRFQGHSSAPVAVIDAKVTVTNKHSTERIEIEKQISKMDSRQYLLTNIGDQITWNAQRRRLVERLEEITVTLDTGDDQFEGRVFEGEI